MRQERSTRQKRALAAVLDASDGFRSAQELFGDLRARGENVGLTTVYNQLRALAEGGEVDALRADDGETLYRRCEHRTAPSPSHLPPLRADRRGRRAEVEQWADRVADAHGFVDVRHTLEIFGTCRACCTPPVGRAGTRPRCPDHHVGQRADGRAPAEPATGAGPASRSRATRARST